MVDESSEEVKLELTRFNNFLNPLNEQGEPILKKYEAFNDPGLIEFDLATCDAKQRNIHEYKLNIQPDTVDDTRIITDHIYAIEFDIEEKYMTSCLRFHMASNATLVCCINGTFLKIKKKIDIVIPQTKYHCLTFFVTTKQPVEFTVRLYTVTLPDVPIDSCKTKCVVYKNTTFLSGHFAQYFLYKHTEDINELGIIMDNNTTYMFNNETLQGTLDAMWKRYTNKPRPRNMMLLHISDIPILFKWFIEFFKINGNIVVPSSTMSIQHNILLVDYQAWSHKYST